MFDAVVYSTNNQQTLMEKTRLFARCSMIVLFLALITQVTMLAQNSKSAGTITVKGTVYDTDKEPIPGVYVFAQDGHNGVVTDINGIYAIDVKADDSLTYQFMGMKSQRIAVNGKTRIDVTLESEALELLETMVTGYQTISRERSAGSFSALRGSAIADKANSRGSLLESLEGMSTGFLVNMGSSANEAEKFIVRGVNSINSNKSPLFVVDGVPVEGSSIEALLNGDDIASITVLKDATAASIWGSQAANGVIVIETKSGRNTNGKFSVSYSGTYTYKGMPDYEYQDMMDSKTFIKNALEVFDPVGYKYATIYTGTTGGSNFLRNATAMPHELIMYDFANGKISESERDAQLAVLAGRSWRDDYEKYMMSNAWLTKHQVSVEGGTAKAKMYASVGYEGNKGNSKDYTGTMKMNVRGVFDVSERIRLDLGMNAAVSEGNNHLSLHYGAGRGMTSLNNLSMSSLPYAALFDENGNALDHSVYDMGEALKAQVESVTGKSIEYHPLDDFNGSMNKKTGVSIRANAGLTIKIIDGLKYEGRFAYNRNNVQAETYMPADSYFIRYERAMATDKNTKVCYGPSSGGDLTTANSYGSDWTIRNQLSLDKEIASRHHVSAIAGVELRENHAESNNNLTVGYDYQTMTQAKYDLTRLQTTLTTGLVSPMGGSTGLMIYKARSDKFENTDVIYRYFSMYANASYSFEDRYSVNASMRIDQSNLFGTDPSIQFKPIWSTGAVWNAKNESVLKDVDWLSKLSVRVSYGLGGNSPTSTMGGPFNIMTAGTAYQNIAPGVTYYINSPANDKIHWEKTTTTNIGVDYAFFRHKLYGSVDFYNKHTTDLLATRELDATVGAATITSNVGSILNRGVELTLGGTILRSRSFMWDMNANFTYNKNVVEEAYYPPLTAANDYFNRASSFGFFEGLPMRAIYAYTWGGLNPEKGTPQIIKGDGTVYSGAYSSLTPDDVKYMGTSIPPFFGSITSNWRYKGLTLSMMFVYNFGHKIFDDQLAYWYDRMGESVHNDFDKRWREPGDEKFTNVPSYLKQGTAGRTYSYEKNLYLNSDIHVLNGAFIKLRELKLSYDLPSQACKAMKISNMSVYGLAGNLFYIAANKEGVDPEWSASTGGYRPAKMGPSYTFGVNVKF